MNCPSCGSKKIAGLMAAFWVTLDGDGAMAGQWNDYESCTEIGPERMCQECQCEFDEGEQIADESWRDFAVRVCNSIMDTKRLCYRIVRGREFGLCPPCGALPPCLTYNTTVIKCNCTKDDVLKMIEIFKEQQFAKSE